MMDLLKWPDYPQRLPEEIYLEQACDILTLRYSAGMEKKEIAEALKLSLREYSRALHWWNTSKGKVIGTQRSGD